MILGDKPLFLEVVLSHKHSVNFNRILEECQIPLSLQKKDLKVREAKLAEDQTCGPYPYDRRDVPAKLEELHERMARVEEKLVVEAEKLAALVEEVSKAFMDLKLPPIQEVPKVLRKVQEVLKAVGLILERLRGAHASGVGP
jgi:hypothetical protein